MMSLRESLYYIFYIACFASSIITGIITGFRGDSHTPPIPFGIESLALPIGLLLYMADKKFFNPTKVHKIGITLNAAVLIFVIFSALVD
ncbi:hypothetical protein [Mucilaginibacter sp. CSA2-8R]|uniref:hypothetical protein n=1 Tax=Mucilaginibacter sp. CSA2-8R TaxID=3141542 RepID=UPI00315CDCB9